VSKPKFCEVVIPPAGASVFPSHSLAGYNVCSDYEGDAGRHLFFRKPESVAAPKTRKPRAKKATPYNPVHGEPAGY
jgi:hypothetical protein